MPMSSEAVRIDVVYSQPKYLGCRACQYTFVKAEDDFAPSFYRLLHPAGTVTFMAFTAG